MRTRRNPTRRPPTAREQSRYASGYSRTFRKTTKRKATKKAKRSGTMDRKRAGKREMAFRRLKKQGYDEKSAARRAMREVPYRKAQRGHVFHGEKVFTGKAKKTRQPAQYKKRKVRVTKTVQRKVSGTKTKRQRVAYGRFKRVKATDPRTGRKRLSYLYRGKKGRRRKIPAWAIAGAPSAKAYKSERYGKARARIQKRRESAARRVTRRGDAFTPNRRKKKMRRNKSSKRSRAAKKGWATRRRKRTARRTSARKGRRKARRNPSRASSALATNPRRKRRKVRRNAAAKATPNRRRRRSRRNAAALAKNPRRRRRSRRNRASTALATNPRRRRRRSRRNARSAVVPNRRRRVRRNRSRSAAAKAGWRKRRAHRKARIGRGKGRAGVYLKRGRVYYRGRKPRRLRGVRARRLPKARVYITNRRRKSRRKVRRNGRRSYRRNAFGANLKEAVKTAGMVLAGFLGHKFVTGLVMNKLMPKLMPAAPAPMTGLGGPTMQKLMPLLVGGVVAAGGVYGASKLKNRARGMEISAGLVTSFLHTALVTALDMSDGTRKALPYIAGYDTSSTAAAIGAFRRNRMNGMRGMRGLGSPATSILPMYAPTGMPGGIQQAVAMSGGRGRGTGEYFQTSGVGEYFASGVQGIGAYEPAGPLVTQAAAGLGQQIDNGIMPSQADAALTLAEAQAGTGGLRGMRGMGASMMGPRRGVRGLGGGGRRGMGEFFAANAEGAQYTLPTANTWIPGETNPALWAGTSQAQDALTTSEIPAGVLESASGNGIF